MYKLVCLVLAHSGCPIRLENFLFASELQWNLYEQDIQRIVLDRFLDLRNRIFTLFVFPILGIVYASKVLNEYLMNEK